MVSNVNISHSIFEALGAMGSMNNLKLGSILSSKYRQFAVAKLKETLLLLKGCIYELREYTPELAEKEASSLLPFLKVVSPLKETLSNFGEGSEMEEVRLLSLEVINTLEYLYVNLKDISLAHYSYMESIPVLSRDWDREEDDHWDEY